VLILTQLAQLNGQAGKPQALDYARRAHELSPDDPQIQGTYGWLLAENQDTRQGLALLEAAIEQAPDNPEIRYHLAATLALTGKIQRARQELQTLLAMNQDVIDPRELQRALDDLVVE
jgi:cytochrome c-type biogenesis protein CcmH/NrfG